MPIVVLRMKRIIVVPARCDLACSTSLVNTIGLDILESTLWIGRRTAPGTTLR